MYKEQYNMQVNGRLLTTILYLQFRNCIKKISDSVVRTNSLEREIPLDSGFKRRRGRYFGFGDRFTVFVWTEGQFIKKYAILSIFGLQNNTIIFFSIY